jgi:hypothetical protein
MQEYNSLVYDNVTYFLYALIYNDIYGSLVITFYILDQSLSLCLFHHQYLSDSFISQNIVNYCVFICGSRSCCCFTKSSILNAHLNIIPLSSIFRDLLTTSPRDVSLYFQLVLNIKPACFKVANTHVKLFTCD